VIDDMGAIIVIAFVYSSDLQLIYLAGAAIVVGALYLLNRIGVYRLFPYIVLGVALWLFIHAAGIHATLAGVVLALFIPTRPPPNLKTLAEQAKMIIAADANHDALEHNNGPSMHTLQQLDEVHDQVQSPAARLLRNAGGQSSYIILPLFALANAGVLLSFDAIAGQHQLMLAIMFGLVLGKPLGMLGAAALAVKIGIASKPAAYSWSQLGGAGALAGIGFTMSLFVAGQALSSSSALAAAKIAIFASSIIAASIGIALLRSPNQQAG